MVQWASMDSEIRRIQAFPSNLNKGVLDNFGLPRPQSVHIYVDDALLAAIGQAAMELALAALLLEAKNNDDNIRTKESLSLLEELQYKLKAYICKKCWICTDPEFIAELESYSRLAPEPETYCW